MKPRILSTALVSLLVAQSAHADIRYWDNNTTTSGFGTAGGTWNSAGSTLWNGDSTGGSADALFGTTIATTTSDALNFGTATDGLGAGTVSISGTVIANSLTFGSASGAVVLSGGTAINLGGTTPTITVNNTEDTIASNITGTVGFTKDGAGSLTLSTTAKTFTGDIIVNKGTLKGTFAGAFGNNSVAHTINVNTGGILDFGTSNMFGGHTSTIGNLVIGGGTVTNSGTTPFNSLNNVTLNGGTLTSTSGISTGEAWGAWHINGTVTSTGTSLIEGAATSGRHIRLSATSGANTNFDVQSGTLTVSAPIYNGGRVVSGNSLTKIGSGTMILSGVNAYTGVTTVKAGKLTIDSTGNINTTSGVTIGTASIAATSEFNFNSSTALTKTVSFAAASTGGTLSGTGTINNAVSITTGNALAIGNSVGQMNFGSTLGLAGTTVMEIDGTVGAGLAGGHDFANVTGTLTYGGALNLDLGATFGTGTYSWNLFDFAGADIGTFSTITLADQYSGSLLDGDSNGIWDLNSGSNTWQFTESTGVLGLTVVPEPRAALLGGLGLLALLRRRRA